MLYGVEILYGVEKLFLRFTLKLTVKDVDNLAENRLLIFFVNMQIRYKIVHLGSKSRVAYGSGRPSG